MTRVQRVNRFFEKVRVGVGAENIAVFFIFTALREPLNAFVARRGK